MLRPSSSPIMTQQRWWPWNLILGLLLALQAHSTPTVNVGMNAAFPAGPYLLELLETAAAENSSSYFPLLDRIAAGHFASASTDAALYAQVLDVLQKDGSLASPEALSTFKLALSLRSAAPRIEAHYQYYTTAVASAVDDAAESGCTNWVLLEGKQYCTPELDVVHREGLSSLQAKDLPFDRTLGVGKEAVLYADPASSSFGKFHKALAKAARQGSLSYRLRYRRSETTHASDLPISGYGVELALKRTDYIVLDDRSHDEEAHAETLTSATSLDDDEDVSDIKPLASSDLSSLGLKAASFILQSDKPLDTLIKLTQDLPRFLTSIVAHNVSSQLDEELQSNSALGLPEGMNVLLVNGVQLIERQIEPFALIERLRQERRLIDGFRALGLSGKQAVSILGHQSVSLAKDSDEPLRYDWTDRLEDGRVLIWLNDLENDDAYEHYPKSITSLLQRAYPGQLPPIAKNIFTLVAPVDFSSSEDVSFVAQLLSFISRGIAVRFGLVPLTPTSEATTKAKMAYHILENYGVRGLIGYLGRLQQAASTLSNEGLFAEFTAGHELLEDSEKMTLAEVLEADTYQQQLKLAQQWTSRLKVDTPIRPTFFNGLSIPRDESWMQRLGMQIGEDLQTVQKGVFHGLLTDDDWAPGLFLSKAITRRNSYITPDDEKKSLRVLNINKIYKEHANLVEAIPVLEAAADSQRGDWAAVTVIADLTTTSGKELVLSALEFKRRNPSVRMDIIHNPTAAIGAASVTAALKANQGSLSGIQDIDELATLLQSQSEDSNNDEYLEALEQFLSASKIPSGARMIMLNGRLIGPISEDSEFDADDFQQFLEVERTKRILPVYAAIEELGLSDKLATPLDAARLTSITALSTISELPEGIFESTSSVRTTLYDKWQSTHSVIERGDEETASIFIVGLLNPVSEQGQRWAPILRVLSELEGVHLELFINPMAKVEELPVKRFFRYVLESQPSFSEDGGVRGLVATFKNLPSEALLTTAVDVPPAWLVAPLISVHDLDNIKLSAVKTAVHATYVLKHILIEGHSREGKGSAPRGAQLVLATEKDPLVTDTIVMSNLGFFQFKANPGVYSIRLKEGRNTEVYEIESIGAQGWNPVAGDNGTELALIDFQGVTLYPRLKRRAGMEMEDVLQEKEPSNNIVAKGLKLAEGFFGGRSNKKSLSAQEHAEINIFSVASGHLYERMLNIMILSVMRNTKHTVKFWFIEQFLSPSFKEFIPRMAQEYGFKYEMVSYKWPHWLRQQKEKQREIWGYKILFLDVLFPLSLDKVIFVDADQVVRTDMIELMNLDLEGAPYGFTPMCDSRTEMEGFRFWKQGYWANYLRGRPYHISALYVVDLRRFRELAAGDRLRQQYHSLSADPNSLANLDQDLPNHMQFHIPIHSLPQEWLWCETWCSDESLGQARTIDLCNNPLTKEPKLDRARRQIPEWTAYDEEIAALRQLFKKETGSAGKEKLLFDNGDSRTVESGGKNTKSRNLEGDKTHTKDEL